MSVICRLPGCRPTGVSMCSLELSASSRGRSGRCEMGWMLRRSPTYDARRGGRGAEEAQRVRSLCRLVRVARGRAKNGAGQKERRRKKRQEGGHVLASRAVEGKHFPPSQSRDAAGSYGRSLTQTGCALLWLAHPSQGWANQKRAKSRPLCVRSVCARGEAGGQSSHTKNGIRFW